jgi:MFS family permease
VVAFTALAILSVSFAAPFLTAVALKPMAEEFGGARSIPALAGALAYLGAGLGGIVMGWVAERTGVRWTVVFGALMIASGLALSTGGSPWQLYVGHGLLIGLLGNGGIFPPLMTYVSHWFDRRRGTALALISSGQSVAGAIWPPLFERSIAAWGWRQTMLLFGAIVVAAVVPLAMLLRRAPSAAAAGAAGADGVAWGGSAAGLSKNAAFVLLSLASFLCCVPMAMPLSHLVAFCTDVGISPTRGALMLSALLGLAFLSRQFWGWVADRIGGLRTLLIGSACQAIAIAGFLITQDELGLFAVSAAFGLGFAGIIPAYIVTIRDLFPAAEASWRVPTLLFCSLLGMAFGGWFAGVLYDRFGYYAPAFALGGASNLVQVAVVGVLVAFTQQRQAPRKEA